MGKLVVKLIDSSIDAINAARNRSSSYSSHDPTTKRELTADQSGEFVIADDKVAGALIREGYAELPAPDVPPVHTQYAELPASFSIPDGKYAELLGPETQLHDNYAELPSVSYEDIDTKKIEEPHAVDGTDTKYSPVERDNWDAYSESNYSPDFNRGIDQDEAVWTLDEKTRYARPPAYEESGNPPSHVSNVPADNKVGEAREKERQEIENMVRDLLDMAGPPNSSTSQIPGPVVIPQRRPGSKFRGFVRAYAPELADCGISQDMFLEFLEDIYQSSKVSRSLEVIGIATDIVTWVPGKTDVMTETLMKIVAGSIPGSRYPGREPTFLDSANEFIFMPRGLCAMVVEFKDSVFGPQEGLLNPLSQKMGRTIFASKKLDLTESAMSPKSSTDLYEGTANQKDASASSFQPENMKRNSKASRNNVSLQIELPESRPLVFPDLDCAAVGVAERTERTERARPGGKEKHKMLKAAGGWIGDQYERRKLESEKANASRMSYGHTLKCLNPHQNDTIHSAHNGKLISAITGGRLGNKSKPGLIHRAAASIKEAQEAKRATRSTDSIESNYDTRWTHFGKDIRSLNSMKKVLQPNVQYLVIVNMPSQEELQQSATKLEYIMKEKGLPIANGFGQ
ncbi:hypothetical protein N7481_000289 [Penicillium waksmanii]|uniref:uncharacterized protein n=1 Tax=Penicillium waksmanii TaxID=69791 RepID=UPI0025474195|nr:uncharacterized protein N7481_000289 [Penicillium waksmanii]KAJ5999880.1 hypothetical protein N7481_000289 [Penicillium waksmanii]